MTSFPKMTDRHRCARLDAAIFSSPNPLQCTKVLDLLLNSDIWILSLKSTMRLSSPTPPGVPRDLHNVGPDRARTPRQSLLYQITWKHLKITYFTSPFPHVGMYRYQSVSSDRSDAESKCSYSPKTLPSSR